MQRSQFVSILLKILKMVLLKNFSPYNYLNFEIDVDYRKNLFKPCKLLRNV